MNELHIKILNLIKEIDDICRKYNIRYYTAGGTTIGAIRHKGFIPWDDDIDIYMTRDEFYRFREAFKKEKPIGRALECLEDNLEYPGTIPRYIDVTTTDLCRFHCMNTCAGGVIIDIFILDPIPAEPIVQDEYRAKLNIYAEFTMPYYAFSYRNDTKYLDMYSEYRELAEHEGRKKVLEELEKDLFTYSEDECEYYMLRWATLPSIFPKEMFGEPIYFPFENIELPLPYKWYNYLKQLYGADWMYVPKNVENQIQHINVVNTEIPYINYTKELDVFINKKMAKQTYERRKLNLLQREKLDRPFREKILAMKAKAVQTSLQQKIRDSEYTLEEMKENEDYEGILKIFDKYLLEQLSVFFAGRMRHGDWYRYKNPIFIQIHDDVLAILVYALVAINEIKKAERLLEIRGKTGQNESEELVGVRYLLTGIARLNRMYYTNNFEKIASILDEFSAQEKKLWPILQIKYLYEVQIDAEKVDLSELEVNIKKFPASMEMLKAYGDFWCSKNELDKAEKIYADVLANSNNGILNLQILEKVGDIKEKGCTYCIEHYKIGEFSSNVWYKKQFELLKEVHEICKTNGIKYSLANNTALFACYENGLPKNKFINTIMMTAENVEKFIEIIEKEKRLDREIDYMKTNSAHIGDDLYYGNLTGAYASLNTLYHMKSMGMFIRIVVLRGKSKSKSSNVITGVLEGIRTANCNIDKIHKSTKRRAIRCGSDILTTLIGKEKLSDMVFDRIVKDTKNSTGEEYFTAKRKRLKKNILATYSSKFFDNIHEILVMEQGEEQKFYILEAAEEYIANINDNFEADLSDSNLLSGLWIFADAELKATELEKIVNWPELKDSVEWFDHLESRSYSKKLKTENARVAKYWKILVRIDDRIKLWQKYEGMKKEIIAAYEMRREDLLDQLLEELDVKVEEYANEKMGFYFVSDVFDIYYEWLNMKGRAGDVERYKQLVPEYYFEPITITK